MFLKIFWQLYFIILDSLKFPRILLYKSKCILLWRGSYIARVTSSPDCQRSPWHKKIYCCVLLRGQSSLGASPLVPMLPCGTPIQPCHHTVIISLLSLPMTQHSNWHKNTCAGKGFASEMKKQHESTGSLR